MNDVVDCAVVGAGAAGLSAALVLGRARRRTLVIDAGEQSNRASDVIGGLLGYDQRPPAELYAAGGEELASYPSVECRGGRVLRGRRVEGGFLLQVDDGSEICARRVLLATGMDYCPPQLPGLAQLWGTSVFQCPFCHGWEMRDKRLAALAAGGAAIHAGLMLRGWTDDLVVLTDGPVEMSDESLRILRSADVTVDDRRIVELIGEQGQLTEIAFADGTRLPRDGLLVEAPLRQRSPLAQQLGVADTAGSVGVDEMKVDALHCTTVDGVFAAGDNCTKHPSLADAINAGSKAAMMIVQSLLADEYGLPYPP
ncbi:MAG TPA: NAD(P)/FAD-dependent oxidoreductase [Mycobacterium sp.]|nr:NAD(P)/FAD-dependent oxidoreductase [Mycobacterium sp.]